MERYYHQINEECGNYNTRKWFIQAHTLLFFNSLHHQFSELFFAEPELLINFVQLIKPILHKET